MLGGVEQSFGLEAEMLMRRLPSTAFMSLFLSTSSLSWRLRLHATLPWCVRPPHLSFASHKDRVDVVSFCSTSSQDSAEISDSDRSAFEDDSKRSPLEPGLYLVGTPIGNLEDITLRALRVLRSANVILSEDTRHSGKLLHYYKIKSPLLSYHKFNELQREQMVLKRLKQGEIVALISDAGTPGISDPGTQLAKTCVSEDIPVIPIPGPCAVVAALSASGLDTDEFTFVGFLPKNAGSRRDRLTVSASEARTQIFYVPPHKLLQFLEETSSVFDYSRQCVIAREITKLHEEFWRGTLKDAKEHYSTHQPKGEITLLIEGKKDCAVEAPNELEIEEDLRELISKGCSLSMAVKTVAERTSLRKKMVYSLALEKFGRTDGTE